MEKIIFEWKKVNEWYLLMELEHIDIILENLETATRAWSRLYKDCIIKKTNIIKLLKQKENE